MRAKKEQKLLKNGDGKHTKAEVQYLQKTFVAETTRSAMTAQSGYDCTRGAVQNRASLSKINFLYI